MFHRDQSFAENWQVAVIFAHSLSVVVFQPDSAVEDRTRQILQTEAKKFMNIRGSWKNVSDPDVFSYMREHWKECYKPMLKGFDAKNLTNLIDWDNIFNSKAFSSTPLTEWNVVDFVKVCRSFFFAMNVFARI